ncbi:MAG TPA: hypothetical protein PLJ21_05755 [Pseudobdellovibrionaceae bacterium]|nr:hypothetical protein [Pseudobdellovibrionaceae bacterium]
MSNIMTDTTNKANGSGLDIKGKMANVESRLERISHDAGEKLGEMVSSVKDTATESVKASREYVQGHPGKSVAIAAASGLVAGALLTYVFRRKS